MLTARLFSCSTINGILAMSSFKSQFSTGFKDDQAKPGISPDQTSLIVSMLSAGTVLGSLISAPIGDIWGRRRSLIGAIGIFCFGVIFQVCASDIPLLLVGRCVEPEYVAADANPRGRRIDLFVQADMRFLRFFAGVGVGIVSVLAPLYQSEMAL